MLRVNMNENVTVHKAPERQAAVQGQLSTGRVVEQNPVTAWIPGQMAGASSTTFRRTISPHSEAVHSRTAGRTADFPAETTVSTKQSETIENQQVLFIKQIDDAVQELRRERKTADNDLSFCLMVVDACRMLEQDLNGIKALLGSRDYDVCHRYMIRKMSALYNAGFRKALEFLQFQITIGCDWVYTKALDRITRYFTKLGYKSANTEANKAWLAEIFQLHINNELDYLEYLKDSPDGHCIVKQIESNIQWMTNSESPAYCIELINDQYRRTIIARMNSLCCKIGNSVNCSDAGKRIENVPHKAANTKMEQRKHHDLIFVKFRVLRQSQTVRISGDSRTLHDRNRIGYLQGLFKLYEEHNKLVGNPHTPLLVELNRLITQIINELQVKLENGIYDGDQTLKEEVLSLLEGPETKKWLKQSQDTAILAVSKGSVMIYSQLHDCLNGIYTLLYDKSHDQDIMVLTQLKQFLDMYEDKLKQLSTHHEMTLRTRLDTAGSILFAKLCGPVLDDYKMWPHDTWDGAIRTGALMCRHKNKMIELTPYIPYLSSSNNTKARDAWQCAACFAWFDDLRNLCCQTSFTEKDVDNLLDLKDAAPDLPSYIVGDYLVMVLTRLFPFMLQTNPNTALIEKVTKLSEWIYYLGRKSRHNHGISQELYEYNEEWREKYIGKAGERAMTSSNTSAARMPSSVHPGTLSVLSSETFDCFSRMRLQDVPYMQQSSIPFPCPSVPTPAPCGAFQQSVSSTHCRTVAQPAAGSGQPPSLSARSCLPRIPAPACNRADFHQPPVCGRQIRSWWRQAESQQQYENPDDRPCI